MKTFEFNGRAIRYFMADGDAYFVLADIYGAVMGSQAKVSHKNRMALRGASARLFRCAYPMSYIRAFGLSQIKRFLSASKMPSATILTDALEKEFGEKS